MSINKVKKAVSLAGGPTALARELKKTGFKKCSQSHIYNWLHRDKRIPPEYVIPVETIVCKKVNRHELRIDIYPMDGGYLSSEDQAA